MSSIIFTIMFTCILMVPSKPQENKSFYDFQVIDINGKNFDFSSLKGKKVLVVNTASKCGFAPQYAQLQQLYEEFGSSDFIVIGFPSDNFLGQEFGTDEEIKEFCQLNYGVSFPMMSKSSVRGSDMNPVFEWLTSKNLNGVMNSSVKWNFQKYMIDENGKLVGLLRPGKKPYSDEIINWLNGE